jgi:hypothetical protein
MPRSFVGSRPLSEISGRRSRLERTYAASFNAANALISPSYVHREYWSGLSQDL